MSNDENPNINGFAYDHSSCRFRLDGVVETQVKSITYGAGFDGANQLHGASTQPIAETKGIYKPDQVSLELFKVAGDRLLARLDGRIYIRRFPIIVERSDDGQPFKKDIISGARILKVEDSSSEGGEAAVMKFTLSCMYVLLNGKVPFPGFKR